MILETDETIGGDDVSHDDASIADWVEPWVCLDIETTHARPEDIDREAREDFDPGNRVSKPETVGNKWFEWKEKLASKSAILDSAPITTIAARTPRDITVWSIANKGTLESGNGQSYLMFDDGRDMLKAFRDWANERIGIETEVCGHNIKGFDFIKLRSAMMVKGLTLPGFLVDRRQAVYDTMTEYFIRFSRRDNDKATKFVSADTLFELYGIESHKGIVDGAKAITLYEDDTADSHNTLMAYCALDVVAEAELYLRMTGQSTQTD